MKTLSPTPKQNLSRMARLAARGHPKEDLPAHGCCDGCCDGCSDGCCDGSCDGFKVALPGMPK